MTILAIDPSTKATGIAIFSDNNLIHYECITAGSADLFNRIDKMIARLEAIILEYEVNYIYIESVFPEDVGHNQTVFDALKFLQGFILRLLDKHKLKYTFFTPSEWRSKCGIRTGRGVKRDVLKAKDIKFIQEQFGILVNDDIADAICIGFAGLGLKPSTSLTIKTDDDFEFG